MCEVKNYLKKTNWLIIFALLLTAASLYSRVKTPKTEYPYIKIPKDIEEVGEFKNDTFLIKKAEKYGLMRIDTTIVVEPVWDFIDSFNKNGYSIVGENGKFGVINKHQDITIPIMYDSIKSTSSNNFIVSENGKWGIVDWKNNSVVPVKYENISETKYGKYIIKENGKFGVINTFGNIIIPAGYTGLNQINRKTYIAATGKHEKIHIIGSNNDFSEVNIDLYDKYDKILSYCYHMSIVQKDGINYLLNLNTYEMKILGKDIEIIGDFVNRMAVIKDKKGYYGVINEEGNVVIEPKYQYLSLEGNELILFKCGKDYGYMDRMENIIIPAAFKEITPFYKDRAIFKVNGKEGVVDIRGKAVVPPEYMEVIGIKDDAYILRTEKGVGVFGKKGNIIIEPKYYSITFFGKNNFKVMDRGTIRIFNYAGKEVFSIKASEIVGEWREKGQINLKDKIYLFI